MTIKTPITLAYGDGIGPEIMRATLNILHAARAQIEPDVIEVGEKIYLQGHPSGILDTAWTSLKHTKVLLKGPIRTPQGGGYKSLNVTLRKTLDLFANVRPCISYAPYVATQHPNMNLVIIRENEEDMYAGIEHRQTDDVYQCLKLISRPGCECIVRYAFEYARKFNRKKITCFSKDNIMKMTDGLFHHVFDEIAQDYPDIQHDHLIVDIGTALLATHPEYFDVIVTLNLYGDIISDVAAQIAGSVGLAGSANMGNDMAMFEAIHGSAPDIAGKNIANPSGLLNAAIQMLVHIHQPDIASLIENAWLKTLEAGIHTSDIYTPLHSKKKVGTQEFAEAVITHLGQKPTHFAPVHYQPTTYTKHKCAAKPPRILSQKNLVGVDIFIDNPTNISANILSVQLKNGLKKLKSPLELITITSRGLKIWPDNTDLFNHYLQHCCCRFQSSKEAQTLKKIPHQAIHLLLMEFDTLGLDVIKTENLYTFDGQLGFTLAQGE